MDQANTQIPELNGKGQQKRYPPFSCAASAGAHQKKYVEGCSQREIHKTIRA